MVKNLFRSLGLSTLMLSVIAATAITASALVPETPRRDTPIPLDGEVWAVEKIGDYIVVGGNFTQIEVERNGAIVNQAGIFAYHAETGEYNFDFAPTLLGNNVEVRAIESAGEGLNDFFIGGAFTQIDDGDGVQRWRLRIAKLNAESGMVDRSFALSGVNAKVLDLERTHGHLYVGGNFTTLNTPQGTVQQNSIMRVDPNTGANDSSFRFESSGSLGDNGALGVTNIDTNGNGRIVVSHRGHNVVNLTTGQVFERPGIYVLDVNGNTFVNQFRALNPDGNHQYANDTRCGDAIRQRDLEVSPDGTFFVIVHQGHDRGWACDTAVKWSLTDAPTEPDWVHRMFDSTFSVAIDDDAIYVGGHHRYMIHPSAPSPYPGDQPDPTTGEVTPYNADPTNSRFNNDLVATGYVYPVNQLGAIDPVTGYGIPDWTPTSNAQLGVLELTVVDDGLLLGQDNDRVNQIRTGGTAYLDTTPKPDLPPVPTCSVVSTNPVMLEWTDVDDAYAVRINNSWLAQTANNTYTHDQALGDNEYVIRYRQAGQVFNLTCN